jgi:hypothetical protein
LLANNRQLCCFTKKFCVHISQGLFVLNLACRDSDLRAQVVGNVRAEFPFVVGYKIPEEVNEIVLASRRKSQLHLDDGAKKRLEPTVSAFRKINQVPDFFKLKFRTKSFQTFTYIIENVD